MSKRKELDVWVPKDAQELRDILSIFLNIAQDIDVKGSKAVWLDEIKSRYRSKNYPSNKAMEDYVELFEFIRENDPNGSYLMVDSKNGICTISWVEEGAFGIEEGSFE